MKIILDTNVITKDYSLQGGRILKLRDASKQLGYEVLVPQIVIDEIFHQYREELENAYNKYLKDIRTLSRLGLKEMKMVSEENFVEDTIKRKQEQYLKQLHDLGVKTMPYPKTRHDFLVYKELSGKKPFTSSEKGYRDSLIWEAVKEQLMPGNDLTDETQVLFLSANTRDFAGKNKQLHPDLVKEVVDLGNTEKTIILVADFDKFFNETINQELKELENIANTLKNDRKYNRINLDRVLETILYDEYVYGDYLFKADENGRTLLPQMYENPSVQDVTLHNIKSVTVHQLTDGSAIVDCEVDAEAEIEFFLFRGDYALVEDNDVLTIIDREWNEHYYLASTGVTITAKVTLRVSRGFYKLLSSEVQTRDVAFVE